MTGEDMCLRPIGCVCNLLIKKLLYDLLSYAILYYAFSWGDEMNLNGIERCASHMLGTIWIHLSARSKVKLA